MIDTVHAVYTPEGVELSLHVAGPCARGVARLIDFAVQLMVGLVAAQILGLLGEVGVGLLLILGFSLFWLYPVALELLWDGQTIGKRMLGLRAVHEDGTPIGLRASLVRSFLIVVDFMPAWFVAGAISMVVDPSFRRLGDLAAGTLVIYDDRDADTHDPIDLSAVQPLAPSVPLTLDEQSAIVAFAQRAPRLSRARVAELAEIAVPLTGRSDPESTLLRIAAHLLGADR